MSCNDIIYETLITGDIILFGYNNSIISNLVQIATSSVWTHVGIVIKNPDFLINSEGIIDGLFLLNSDGQYEKDIETNEPKFGVQLVDLRKKIENYDGLIVARHLLKINETHTIIENKKRNEMFTTAYQSIFGKSYDYIPLNLLITIFHSRGYEFADNWINNRHTDYLFCSAMVTYIYTITGIMDKHTKWSLYTPDFFSQNCDEFLTLNNYVLSPLLTIKDTRNKTNDDEQNKSSYFCIIC